MSSILHELLASVPEARRSAHPLVPLVHAQDGRHREMADRLEYAFSRVRRMYPEYAESREQILVNDADLRNAAASLGEIRALATLSSVWGQSISTPAAGADYTIRSGESELRIEVATVLGSTVNTRIDEGSTSKGRVTTHFTSYAPFGYASPERPEDTIQGNAVSRLASIKQREHQAHGETPTLLWLDFDDQTTFPLSIGINQTQPLIGGGNELVSGAIWWAQYGERGDHVFDSWNITEPLHRKYRMEFNGRFARESRYAGVVISIDGNRVLHQNNTAPVPLIDQWIIELIALPGCVFEQWWVDWPVRGSLASRIAIARAAAETLVTVSLDNFDP